MPVPDAPERKQEIRADVLRRAPVARHMPNAKTQVRGNPHDVLQTVLFVGLRTRRRARQAHTEREQDRVSHLMPEWSKSEEDCHKGEFRGVGVALAASDLRLLLAWQVPRFDHLLALPAAR